LRIAVLKGGDSLERGVSLRSAARVELALAELGHEAVAVEPGPRLVGRLRDERPDLAFVALRGGGEDGTVQELLEILDIPFTGPSAGACARCTDRIFAKHELRGAGVPTPDWFALRETAFRELGAADALGELEQKLGFPLVIKPSHGGSALGIEVAASWFEVPEALISAFVYDERVLLERFVAGAELKVSLLGGEVLGGAETAAGSVARAAYEALGCAGFAQVTLIAAADGPLAIEIDPAPDLGEAGELPRAAETAGIGFAQLIGRIVELALNPAAG
jgi:D-alanine-D-alanine ligase